MDIFSSESGRRVGEQSVLRKVDAVLDWGRISALVTSGLNRSRLGPCGYDLVVLFKCLLLGQWHGLSDPKLEESLRVQLDFMLFAGLDLHSPVPDETTQLEAPVLTFLVAASGVSGAFWGVVIGAFIWLIKTIVNR